VHTSERRSFSALESTKSRSSQLEANSTGLNPDQNMPLVPAGDETGDYYIIVAGLPWNCSWQRLKDFARNQQLDGSYIEVDHAMIYPHNQTNGWVRVKGKDNFLRALGMPPPVFEDHG
jgi:hypothetical protein